MADPTCFDPAAFDSLYFDTCAVPPPPVTDIEHSGLLLNPPPGWRAISERRPTSERRYGPLNTAPPPWVDPEDELWFLNLRPD